jgi:TPR repeat protein
MKSHAVSRRSVCAALALLTAGVPCRVRGDDSITGCDKLAGHPSDPDKRGPGRDYSQDWDYEAGVAACERDSAKDPGNGRLLYNLARLHSQAGHGDKAVPIMERAVALGYRQAVFVYGYLHFLGRHVPKDLCKAGELWLKAARAQHVAGEVGFSRFHLAGRFEGCGFRVDDKEVLGFLASAKQKGGDFYRQMLIDDLQARITKKPEM